MSALCSASVAFAGTTPQWDLLVQVDEKGAVEVLASKPVDSPSPVPAAPPLQEGLTCLELRDPDGRVADRRALPLSSNVFSDRLAAGGRLEGGPAPSKKVQYNLRVPRRPGARQTLGFYRLKRKDRRNPSRSLAAASESDFDFESRGFAVLEEAR